MYPKCKYALSGDRGVLIEVGNTISEAIHYKIRGLVYSIEQCPCNGIVELIPAYNSILLIYDPLLITYEKMVAYLKAIESSVHEIELPPSEIVHMPTLYGGEYGEDIGYVASYNNLTVEEVVQIHSNGLYLIYMLGFTPGFPYLGGMSDAISTPRLSAPREKITKGSVGIAGNQTGIYPIDSPGGWQLIGRTPIVLFDPNREPAVLLRSGQYISFDPIEKDEYDEISRAVSAGTYQVKKTIYVKGK
ncbi:5-oxoprolinase subunit PxpB [Fusibacter ferrireducens]|uniref:5-oxoprolinase subunit PxpB n=1 Tax=Fusibacter ferrireducens TaxID=2785058 RepID=A0ABR9ZVF2_9FIRM|nr:5-oxoprolinase subunit PxpB [Fusibacter ferrireducens]MBF4694427.1 5-oxoprolinase subunit PxpB [Fusibacter ferrireducens]